MNYRSIIKAALFGAALSVAVPAFSAWADAPSPVAHYIWRRLVAQLSRARIRMRPIHRRIWWSPRRFIGPSIRGIRKRTRQHSILPGLVKTSEDGRTFTYELFDNIYFHNGRKLTTDDVVWSYTRIMDPTKGYPGRYKSEHWLARRNMRRVKPRKSAAS
ncbi:hypothetical protein HED63_21850 [Ochrobactrum cytisi]|nr:hypothetical protein [Brucella cytisi]